MTGIPEYKGIANLDVRPLRGAPRGGSAPKGRGGAMVFSVEEMRGGGSIGSPGGGDSSGAENSAGAESGSSAPQGRYRGRKVVPKSYLAAHSDRGLSEAQQVAKLQKIRESAQEYEGMLMKEMVKSMRQSPLTKTPGSDTYSEIAEKPFTAALAAAGGLGLADKIVEDTARQEGLLGALSKHPEIMGPNWKPKISPSRMYKPVNMASSDPQTWRRAPDLSPDMSDPEAFLGPGRGGEAPMWDPEDFEDGSGSALEEAPQGALYQRAGGRLRDSEPRSPGPDPSVRLSLFRESLIRSESGKPEPDLGHDLEEPPAPPAPYEAAEGFRDPFYSDAPAAPFAAEPFPEEGGPHGQPADPNALEGASGHDNALEPAGGYDNPEDSAALSRLFTKPDVTSEDISGEAAGGQAGGQRAESGGAEVLAAGGQPLRDSAAQPAAAASEGADPWASGPQNADLWASGPQSADPWAPGPQSADPWASGPQGAGQRAPDSQSASRRASASIYDDIS